MLTQLTGRQKRQFHEALLAAFPTEEALRLLLLFELDQNLHSLVEKASLSEMVLELIEWAVAQGKIDQLLQGALDTNPDNPKLRAFADQLKGPPPPPPPQPPPPPSPAGSERGAPGPFPHALLSDLESGNCTPILGPGLLEPLFGSPRALARRWAAHYHFPLAPHAQDDLPQVAQFLATVERTNTLRTEFRKYLTSELLDRFGHLLPAEARNGSLDDLLHRVATARWAQDSTDPYTRLAALPFSLYITTNPDNLLVESLRAAGKTPQVELCRWRDDVPWPPSVYDSDPAYQPTIARPLVYYLFGRLNLPVSLVLKEDDYFDYLIGVTRNSRLIPSVVRAALADSGLIFVGFQIDDWGFRGLFRSILGQGAPTRRGEYTHVAVQLDLAADRALEPERACRYLETYFQSSAVLIYWGRAEQFVADLYTRWTHYQTGEDVP